MMAGRYIVPAKKRGYGWFRRGYSDAAGTPDFAGLDFMADTSMTFGIFKEYYPNGKICQKGGRSSYGFAFGKWYYYNEDGSLRKTLDCDKDFKFTARDIQKYCERNNIPLKIKYDAPRIYINKTRLTTGKYNWVIIYPDNNIKQYVILQLSADDGRLLQTNTKPLPVNRY